MKTKILVLILTVLCVAGYAQNNLLGGGLFIYKNGTQDTAFLQTTRANLQTNYGNSGGLYFDKVRNRWKIWDGSAWVSLNTAPPLSSVSSVSGTSPISVLNGTTNAVVSMTAASGTDPGYVTTGSQTIAGDKTFSGVTTLGSAPFIFNNTGGLSVAGSVGTAGQVLTSNGTTTTWQTPTVGIGGTAASTQISYGTGVNTIGSEAAFTYTAGSDLLTVPNATVSTALNPSYLTNGRVTLMGASGLTDDSDLTFSTNTLSVPVLNGVTTLVLSSNSVERLEFENDGAWQVNGSAGTSGQVLVSNGDATTPTWQTLSASIGGTIAATQVGYGSGVNTLTSEAAFTYTAASDLLTIVNVAATAGTFSTSLNPSYMADGRVPFMNSVSGLIVDSDMNFATDRLTVTNITATTDLRRTTATSGRVQIAGASGSFTDDSDLTFSGSTLTATSISSTTIGTTNFSSSGGTFNVNGTGTFSFLGTTAIFSNDELSDISLSNGSLNLHSSGTIDILASGISTNQLLFKDASDNLIGDSDITISGGNRLTATNGTFTTDLRRTSATSGRVQFATTGGSFTDDSDLTFSTDRLSSTNLTVETELRTNGTLSFNGSSGTSGQVPISQGSGDVIWGTPTGNASLTATQVGYGSGSNLVTGEGAFTYESTSNLLSIVNPAATATTVLDGGSYITSSGSSDFKVSNGSGTVTLQSAQSGGVSTINFGDATTATSQWDIQAKSSLSSSAINLKSKGNDFIGFEVGGRRLEVRIDAPTPGDGVIILGPQNSNDALRIKTFDEPANNSEFVTIRSGTVATGGYTSGLLTLNSGTAAGSSSSGNVLIQSGDAGTNSGNLTLKTGTAGTTQGFIIMPTLQTGCGGAPSGALYNDSGTLKICP